jgi:hypothetical protein
MKIDDGVELRVRETLHWVVKQNAAEFQNALTAFPDPATRVAALELLGAVAGFVLADMHGGKPSPNDVDAVAAEIAEEESWASVTSNEAAAYLNGVFTGQPLVDVLPPDRVVVLAFVIAAYLLSARPKEEGEWWFNYLDKVESAIESAA